MLLVEIKSNAILLLFFTKYIMKEANCLEIK